MRDGKARRIGLIGATARDARQVMVEGESGLLAVADGVSFQPSNNLLRWPDGAEARLLSAAEPDSFRGHQFDCLWGDEFSKWQAPQTALDMALMGLRLGDDPRMLLTTTPRAIPALRALLAAPEIAVTRSPTAENAANLAHGFADYLRARYAGTQLGRQELEGELIEDNEQALWQRAWIEAGRLRMAPLLPRVVVAVDPPVSSHGDECGIVVAGRDHDGHGHVLADRSAGGLSPAAWAARAAEAYEDFQADAIIAEANQGGEMVRAVLAQAGAHLPVLLVQASRGKLARAAPAAALYEQGRTTSAPSLSWRTRCASMTAAGRRVPTAWTRWSGRWRICSRVSGASRRSGGCEVRRDFRGNVTCAGRGLIPFWGRACAEDQTGVT